MQEASAGEPGAAIDVKSEEEFEAEDGAGGGSQPGAQSRPDGPAVGTRRRPHARTVAEEDSDADAGGQSSPREPLSSAASSSSSGTGGVPAMWDLTQQTPHTLIQG